MRKVNELAEGTIAYFFQLHLDTAVKREPHPNRADVWHFQVEGKARPMLIWNIGPNDRGCRWLRVFRITTKPLDSRDRARPNLIRAPGLVNENVVSYVDADSNLNIPESLLQQDDRSRTVIRLDRLVFQGLMTELNRFMLSRLPQVKTKS